MKRKIFVCLFIFVVIPVFVVYIYIQSVYSSGTEGYVKQNIEIPLELRVNPVVVEFLNNVNDLANQKALLDYQFKQVIQPVLGEKVSGVKRLKIVLLGASIAEREQDIEKKFEVYRAQLPSVQAQLMGMEEDAFHALWLKLESRLAMADSVGVYCDDRF